MENGNILQDDAQHAYEAHHEIDLNNIQVLDVEGNQQKRLIRESLRIRTMEPSMNRERGCEVPLPFLKLVKTTRGRQRNDEPDVTLSGPDPSLRPEDVLP